MKPSLDKLQKIIDYQFNDIGLLQLALTHRSANSKNNERLEFLGDALLGSIIAEALFVRFSHGDEGQLTRLRSSLVKKETLAGVAEKLDLGTYIILGEGEMKSGGWRRASTLSNTVEAVIGAIYLDSNYLRCQQFVIEIFSELLAATSLDNIKKDPKTRLQEFLQSRKQSLPVYEVMKTEGSDHNKNFTVNCVCDFVSEPVQAQGSSRRKAEQMAAELMLENIKKSFNHDG